MATYVCLSSLFLLQFLASPVAAATAPLFPFESDPWSESDLAELSHGGSSLVNLLKFGDASKAVDNSSTCKVFPGDSAWPSTEIWDDLNVTFGNIFIKTKPSAVSCYTSSSYYDAAHCAYVRSEWSVSAFHAEDPTSIMSPLWQGRTCLPNAWAPTGYNASCTLGGYPSYAVNVSKVEHIQVAVNFARNQNLRLVVKNTGHDFNGKSVGAGALSIWSHNLKDIAFYSNYSDSKYSGPAFKIAAGVQIGEIYAAANQHGVTVIGAEASTVGIAGGYTAGGGHSPLSSLYGLAADQVVALSVVTPNGRFVSLTEEQDSELFWALRGGGGATFGVVTSLVIKAHPGLPVVVTSTFSFGTSSNVTADKFWLGVRSFFSQFPKFVDAGTYTYFSIVTTGNSSFSFNMAPFFAPNHTKSSFQSLTSVWFADLANLGIAVSPNTTAHNSFYSAWAAVFPGDAIGGWTQRSSSRLFPRSNFVDETSFNATFGAIQNTTSAGYPFLGFSIGAPLAPGNTAGAVLPAWRDTVCHAITAATWTNTTSVAGIKAASKALTNEVMDQWRAVSPDSGAYMSEADIAEPNFQQAFYGSNYARLSALKTKLDPWGLFYAPTAVGSEGWKIEGGEQLGGQDGRLCRV